MKREGHKFRKNAQKMLQEREIINGKGEYDVLFTLYKKIRI